MNADVWLPTPEFQAHSNLSALINRLGAKDYDDFLKLSVEQPELFWQATLEHLGITFDPPASAFCDLSKGKPWPTFFKDAGFNFAAACIKAPAGNEDRLAISWEDEAGRSGQLTYAELARKVRRFASGLCMLGVAPGDRVGFLFPNTAEAVISFLAIGYLGAIVVPLYSGYGEDAVARRLIDAEASCLITADGFLRKGRYISLSALADTAKAKVPSLKALVIAHVEGRLPPRFVHHAWTDVASSGNDDLPPYRTAANDPFMVIYTSGTSGRPKGAVHVHGGFPLRVAQDVAFMFDFKPGDRYFWMSDMGWMVGPFSICSVFLNKGTLVLYDGSPDVPDIGRLRAVAGRHGVTHFGSSPTSVRAMAADDARAMATDMPALRVMMTGGEVMDAEAHHWFFQRFGGGRAPIINYTGGTEVSGAILTNVVLRPIAPSRFNSTTPGVRGMVLDQNSGTPITEAPGELAIGAPFIGMTKGFWRDTERYLETYWSRFPDIWVHGDLAVAEPDGQYLLLGRSDDVMKISGKRVGPSEVEGIIADGDNIADAVVFSVPEPRAGETMVLFVVPGAKTTNAGALEEQVAKLLKAKMGPVFKPHAVVVVQRLAKTRNGKLVRRLARQAWLGEKAGDLSAIEDPKVFDEMSQACRIYQGAST